MRRNIAALLVPLVGLLTVDAALAAKKPANAPLLKLFETSWQEDLADDPLSATALGDHRYDAQLPNMTPEAIEARKTRAFNRLAALRKIDKTKLEKPDQLNYDLFERENRIVLNEAQFKPYLYAVRATDGPQLLAEFAEVHPFATPKNYDDWIARINASGAYVDQWIVLLGQGAAERRTQPRITIQKVLEQLKPSMSADPETNPFYAPFKKMPASFDAATKDRLTAAAKTAITTVAAPAFQRFDKFFREVYLPASRDTIGIYDTPDGDLYYRDRIKYYTTIDNPDPAKIHNIGLDEVKRIRAEMEKVLADINFIGNDKDPRPEIEQFLSFMRTDPRFFYKTPEELFAAYEKTARGIEPQLPKLFGKLPKTGFGIRAIPAASAPTTTTAYYQPPSLDGSRPGNYYVNLYKPETRQDRKSTRL